MEDEPEDRPDLSSLPQPASPEEPTITPDLTSPATPPSVTPAPPPINSVNSAAKKGGHKAKLIMLVVLLLVVIGAAVGYKVHSDNQQTSSGKKDIPYMTYGYVDSGDITPNYPTETADSSDTIFLDSQLFEGLVRYQDEIKITPALATSWSNPNTTTWIFNLRHGVTFHSGRIMTAADVKSSLDYAVKNQNADDGATALLLADDINKVTVINPYQVKITTNGPDAVLLNQLAASLYIVDSKARLGSPNAGTGPYIVKPGSIKPNATTLDLVAFNNYWGGHVYTRAVHIQEISTDNQLVADTAAGKFDLAGDFDNQQLATIKAKVNYYQPVVIPDLGVKYLELNVEKPASPLYALAARQAAAYALDVPSIIKAAGLNGTLVNQVIPQILPGYDPAIKNTPYDPAKAKQLLTGVPNASAPITLCYSSGDDIQVAEVSKELDAVGFNVKASNISDFSTFVNMIVAGQCDMYYLSYDTSTLDGLDMINNTVAGTQNYTNPELTTLINQASSTNDPATRIAVLQKMEQLVASDVPTIALFTQARTYTLTKPYVLNNSLPAVDTDVYFYQVYQK